MFLWGLWEDVSMGTVGRCFYGDCGKMFLWGLWEDVSIRKEIRSNKVIR